MSASWSELPQIANRWNTGCHCYALHSCLDLPLCPVRLLCTPTFVYGHGAVPRGGVAGDRHLATALQGGRGGTVVRRVGDDTGGRGYLLDLLSHLIVIARYAASSTIFGLYFWRSLLSNRLYQWIEVCIPSVCACAAYVHPCKCACVHVCRGACL